MKSILSVKKNYTIAEGDFNTAPVASSTLSGTISSTDNDNLFASEGLTQAEMDNILQDDGIIINGELLLIARFDSFTGNIYLQNDYQGSPFTDQDMVFTEGPRHAGYPREYSVKGQLYNIQDIAQTSVVQYPFNESKKRLSLIEALSGPVTVRDGMQTPDSGSGSGGSGQLVAVFEPDTVVVGGEGVGYIQDSRMANMPHPPYYFIITVDGVPLNIYSATALDNEVEYNADETLGRFDAINSFEFIADTTILVTIYLLT